MVWGALALSCLFLALGSPSVFAQEVPNDLVSKVIIALFRDHNKKFLCLNEDSSLPAIRSSVVAQLKTMPPSSFESQNAIATVVYTQFPCPFSPYHKGIRPAVAKDLIGVWLFPESSQKLRFGPDAPMWKKQAGAPPIKCEAVAYYENAEARTAQFGGLMACPFAAAKDMDALHKGSPKVETWSMVRNGRLKIDRSDVPDLLEEWDIFFVETPYQAGTITINSGDLLAYRRREKGNDLNVATSFRHLRKLP